MSFQNPKTVCLSTETNFVLNYHSSTIKLSIIVPLARDRIGRNGQANVFQVLAFLFSKCARTDHVLFFSRIELIFFLSLF